MSLQFRDEDFMQDSVKCYGRNYHKSIFLYYLLLQRTTTVENFQEIIRVLMLCKQFVKYHKYKVTARINTVMCNNRVLWHLISHYVSLSLNRPLRENRDCSARWLQSWQMCFI